MNPPFNIQNFDIVIVGGGMVGAALACALGDTPMNIALVESKNPETSWPAGQYDLRVSAISRASQRILEAIEVWPKLSSMRISPYQHMHVWDASGSGVIHFDCADVGESTLGHIIENSVIQTGLYQRIHELHNITLLCPATPKGLTKTPHGYALILDQNRLIHTSLIVGADGSRSWIRQQAGIEIQTHDYQQQAVVATVKTGQHHRYTAWQTFLPTGPLAFLPLTAGYSSIVWSTSTEQARDLLAMDDDTFKLALQNAFDNTLGEISYVSTRAAFPLRSLHANNYVLNNLALVGDAAHTIHPLAGQGVNLGFSDAACLAEVLLDALQQKHDIASIKVLRRYERWRKGDNKAMLNSMSGFRYLFGNNLGPVREIRNLGINITDRLTPAKNFFIRYAMGLVGDLPQLARVKISS